MAFATQLPNYSFSRDVASSLKKETESTLSKPGLHKAPVAELVYQQVQTALRTIPVQKDAGNALQFTSKAAGSFSCTTNLPAIAATPFWKNYIDHIYPSHHFW